jgi:hypothetical protein
MADDTKNATLRSVVTLGTRVAKVERAATVMDSTVEVAAAASAGSRYTFFCIPTNARIHGLSRVAFDDLASTGSPTMDFGFAPVDSNFTADVDALTDGIDVATAAGTANLVKDIANYGKRVWEILGLTTDPGGLANLTGSILDAATNTGGTVTVTLVYSVD